MFITKKTSNALLVIAKCGIISPHRTFKGQSLAKEIERRFLVRSLAKNMPLPEWITDIQQGYFETIDANKSFRVRICSGCEAYLTLKTGKGLVREELECSVDLEFAKALMKTCRHRLNKTRRVIDGWEIDFYKPPLKGIITAEKELKSLKEKLPIPDWLLGAVEITDTLTSHDLAHLATELRKKKRDARKTVRKLLKQRS